METLCGILRVTIGTLYFSLWNSIKNLLPNGILPRKSVHGQRVLITGAGSGIGRKMAVEFAKLGAEVVLWDVNEAGNLETLKTVEDVGGKAYAYTVDLSSFQKINETSKKVREEVGDIDILINNAGIVTGKKIFDCPDELMEKTMAVNCNANFYTAKNFLPAMLDKNHGHVVTIASMAGKTGCVGLVDYCASKHGAIGFHDSLTMEILSQKKFNVKTTVVCPFFINTGMFDGVQTKSPLLFPILEPDYVVECILEAILTNRPMLCMPRACYTILALIGLLPIEVQILLADFFGSNETMNEFKGRQKKVLYKYVVPACLRNKKSLKGKKVLITGSGSGIGRQMALEFAKHHTHLILWDKNQEDNEKTRNLVENLGFDVKIHVFRVDLMSFEEIDRISEETKREAGKIDILVNNAGVASAKGIFELEETALNLSLGVNVKSHF
ncbi:unnamed protein product [Caenorhabditis angaria]|uniref:Uncharacterized protein n=1 Tax=Caenorhabditis angaria TaxID=860376 RepID=A0A9P1ITA5_9PELO|nr:unnamed protein product [Caenorhabditis angaria]